MNIDPRHPVIVGAAQRAVRSADAEPVAMMVDASRGAFEHLPQTLVDAISSVRVVKGIWPYKDPGTLVAQALALHIDETALTAMGGNATYDLVNHTAAQIADGSRDTTLICGAETMRTRRADYAAGRRSPYLDEHDGAAPSLFVGEDDDLVDDADSAAGVDHPVRFYALAETRIRHRRGESVVDHLDRIGALWASGAAVAATNPNAWIRTSPTATEITTPSPKNRMVSSPYPKLMTANINVDQAGAVVMTSYGSAVAAGVAHEQLVFLVSGSGAYEHPAIRERWELDRSVAFDSSAHRALDLAGVAIDDIEHLDLYSCFPSSVQLAQAHLGLGNRPFTMTGGLTFAGGPFNGYCTQALAHAVEVLRGGSESAFLHGNGGFFSKQSVLILSGASPSGPFRYERTQDVVDASPRRRLEPVVGQAMVEAATVLVDHDGHPAQTIIAALSEDGARAWATSTDPAIAQRVLDTDVVGWTVDVVSGSPPTARLLSPR